jgi:hypothetical protein
MRWISRRRNPFAGRIFAGIVLSWLRSRVATLLA